MILEIYRTAGRFTRSILRAEHVTTISTADYPEDPQAFADEHDGDFIEPSNEDEPHGEIRHG